ncbi:MAG TPA: DNA-formamidopyrimidine glycosylase [Planctomycetota bacterium]|nr:DNA-formamidopyrimidine glycosylase [Planctomycetota bacterium]
MPELPEVETVVRMLVPRLVGRSVVGVDVRWQRTLGGASVEEFTREVVGARVISVWRRAKYLVFDLERHGKPAGHLVGHLRMSGRMQVEEKTWDPGIHVRLSFALDSGKVFHFIDVRKFGRLIFAQDLERVFLKIGDEPLDQAFTPQHLHQLLGARKRALKPLLLDQSIVAGLGNIYVDESLHRARLHPLMLSTRVDLAAVRRLHGSIQKTLRAAIEREGSSFDGFYLTPEGQPGNYQNRFRVYGREGKPCKVCKTTIVKFTVGQRGTHVCPTCQEKPRPAKRRSSARARARRGA